MDELSEGTAVARRAKSWQATKTLIVPPARPDQGELRQEAAAQALPSREQTPAGTVSAIDTTRTKR